MRIDPVDDLPFHQTPTPFNVVATSDPHFNDGYWFSWYAPGWFFIAGMRIHPNTNSIDGFVSVAHDGEQRCLRVSRVLRPRYSELEVASLRLEVLDPLARLRLVLGDNPSGIRLDVTLEALAPPFLETRYQHMKYGRLVNDVMRYTQSCRARGTARCDGVDLAVDGWCAMRDHSWGIRSTMGPPSRIGGIDRTDDERDDRALRLWVPFQAGDHSGFFHTHEDRSGATLDIEGRVDLGDGSAVRVAGVAHALEYLPGTRRLTGGCFTLRDDGGSSRDYRFTVAAPPADVQGLGYYGGWKDGGSAGVYRGPETVVETDRYPAEPAEERTGPPHVAPRRRLGPTEYACVLTGPDGARGMALVEHHIYGPYDPYGFS